MVRQEHLIALVVAFLIGCAILLVAGASGVQAEASQQNKQKHTEAPNNEQGRSPEATASEEARCEGTRAININLPARFTTNDLPGCPKGGLLLGTDKADLLAGQAGDDEVRGLGGSDDIYGGLGNDVIYGGPGDDHNLYGGAGNDVIHAGPGDDGDESSGSGSDDGNDVYYGGDGNDWIMGGMNSGEDVIYGGDGNDNILSVYDHQRDKIYCGKGNWDYYYAGKNDYVDSSCEKEMTSNA